jgi:hypothetical protein
MLGPSVKGNGDVTEETRQLSGFDRLEASTGLEVFLVPDSDEYVIVEADDNLHKDIQTTLKGSTLRIFTESRIRWAESRKVFVHYKQLSALNSSSGAFIRCSDLLTTKELEIKASSGSHQYLQIDAANVEGRCSSGAHISISGKCEKANIKASSGAHFKGEAFQSAHCDADASSGAHIWVEVTEDLQAEASSGGHINYAGNPKKTAIRSSSGGSISRN